MSNPTRQQVRDQIDVWLSREHAGRDAMADEIREMQKTHGALTEPVLERRRILARIDGAINSLETVAKLMDGAYR